MNCVVLIGRLTKDPELRYIPQSETAVASFTLAVDRPMAREKTADFIRIVAFGKTAELCERYLTKGRLVGIQGRIQTGSYKTSTGETRYTTDVYADRVEFLDWGDRTGTKEPEHRQEPQIPEGFQALDEDDDDIPF
ncbi:MAG: single-stranded DNA-binding protein [Bacillota bacterium]|jgi:single-strand DNA-binding protein|nr:single-stranded DNA-binding protein [Bacillota bacterium]NLM08507.1 single-stranded DNA-binding protein [Clostridiales Family XIII bacterium]HOA41921.1 single-stranded DNA-binding protein [Bacillota bacterium]HQC82900.1 single-stranded DNA-binding protein [Bacillota bacterium]